MNAYISSITLNDGQIVNLKQNDIVVFVGPNNSGKSRALQDINQLCSIEHGNRWNNEIIIKDLEIVKCGVENVLSSMETEGWAIKNGEGYNVFGRNMRHEEIRNIVGGKYFGVLKDAFLMYINAGNIHFANMASNDMSDAGRQQPIQYLSDFKSMRDKASEGFRRAFGQDLLPHRLKGNGVPLCIGNQKELDLVTENKVGNESLDAYKEFMDQLPMVQEQSDGIKSFASTLINLVLTFKQIYLLDEPETFLHPPQALIMGQLIGEFLNERQAFISTHSQEIIKGLLEMQPERVKIIRITRKENVNRFKILDNSEIEKIWKDPLLKYSDMLNGLFHEKVVLCESDADCKMYSVIMSHCKGEEGLYSQTQFIQSNGKQRMPKVVSALRRLGIDVYCVIDIDLLSNDVDLKRIVETYDHKWEEIRDFYRQLQANLNETVTHVNRITVKDKILEIIDSSKDKDLSKQEINSIYKELEFTSKWGLIKKTGESAIPSGDGTKAYNYIKEYLKGLGVFLVGVGELENFIRSVGGHGPDWVSNVLEEYRDFNIDVYSDIKKFVKSWEI